MNDENTNLGEETTINDELNTIEQLCDHYVQLRRQQNPISVEQFAAQHPRQSAQIMELLPTILMMEAARDRNRGKRKDGRVNRGPEKITQLGDFKIIGELGRGGMGIVYEAHQNSLDRNVALKVLPKHALGERNVAKFNHEASVAANLHHTNIAPVYGVGEANGFHYFAMQLLDGQSLDRFVQNDWDESDSIRQPRFQAKDESPSELDIPLIVSIACQVASALQYAHDLDVVHRDIKPSNLILGPDGHVWVTDFGLAISRNSAKQEPHEGISGTLRYIAPEKLDPTKFHSAVDESSDIYALGITMIELLSGRPAFISPRVNDLIVDIQAGNLAPLHYRSRALPSDLEAVLRKAVAVDPNDRYSSAKELSADLRSFSEGRTVKARPNTLRGDVWRWVKRNPALTTVSSIAFLLLIGTSVISTNLYLQNQAVLKSEREQLLRAENASELATRAVDQMFDQFYHDSTRSDASVQGGDTLPRLSNESAALLKQLSNFYVQLASQNTTDKDLPIKAIKARRRVGEIQERLGQYGEAATAFSIALNEYRGLLERGQIENTNAIILDIARLNNELGVAFRLAGSSDRAVVEHQRVIRQLNQRLDGPMAEDSLLLEVARSHYLIAYRTRPGMGPNSLPPPVNGQMSEVARQDSLELDSHRRVSLEQAIARLKQINVNQEADVESELSDARDHLLALCYREISADEWSKRTDVDYRLHRQSILLLKSLVERHPRQMVYRFDLMRTLAEINVFDPDLDAATVDEAYDSLESAREIGVDLILQEPDVAIYRIEQIHTHFKLGVLAEMKLENAQNDEERESLLRAQAFYFRRANLDQTRLVFRHPDVPIYKIWQARFSLSLAACTTVVRREFQNRLVGRVIADLNELPPEFVSSPEVEQLMEEARELSRTLLGEPESQVDAE